MGTRMREPFTFVGDPDRVVKKLKVFHDLCGTGVVDLGFQPSGTGLRRS